MKPLELVGTLPGQGVATLLRFQRLHFFLGCDMDNSKRFCKNCNTETYYESEVMPEGFPHYAKRVCSECGKFIDWMRKPRSSQSQEEAARVIELKKQFIQLLVAEFHEKYEQQIKELYELEVDYDYTTDNNF